MPYKEFDAIKHDLEQLVYIRDKKGLKTNFPFFKLYEKHGDIVYNYKELKVPKFVKTLVDKNKMKEKVYR